MAAPVAVIGLGIMGSRMAGRLLSAGFSLRGYDPDPARSEEFEAAGGTPGASPAEAVQGCEIALLSLLTSDISREVCLGEGGLSSSGSRSLLVLDATTGRPEDAVEIADQLAKVGIEYADANGKRQRPSGRSWGIGGDVWGIR